MDVENMQFLTGPQLNFRIEGRTVPDDVHRRTFRRFRGFEFVPRRGYEIIPELAMPHDEIPAQNDHIVDIERPAAVRQHGMRLMIICIFSPIEQGGQGSKPARRTLGAIAFGTHLLKAQDVGIKVCQLWPENTTPGFQCHVLFRWIGQILQIERCDPHGECRPERAT